MLCLSDRLSYFMLVRLYSCSSPPINPIGRVSIPRLCIIGLVQVIDFFSRGSSVHCDLESWFKSHRFFNLVQVNNYSHLGSSSSSYLQMVGARDYPYRSSPSSSIFNSIKVHNPCQIQMSFRHMDWFVSSPQNLWKSLKFCWILLFHSELFIVHVVLIGVCSGLIVCLPTSVPSGFMRAQSNFDSYSPFLCVLVDSCGYLFFCTHTRLYICVHDIAHNTSYTR